MASSHSVSTRQAAALLDVHESSVKRWCSSGELPCDRTSGGHRRIPLRGLAAFSDERELPFALRPFGDDAGAVWEGLRTVERKDDWAALVTVLYRWLGADDAGRPRALVDLLQRRGTPLAAVLDGLLAPAMHRIGFDYNAGLVSIGDEHRMTHLVRDLLVGLHLAHRRASAGGSADGGAADGATAVVGCARSEVHELGALMSRLVLEAAGWRVVYLGLNVPTEEFARQQRQHRATLVCIAMAPPTGAPEARVMAEVLRHLYDEQHPYRLVFGGQAVAASVRDAVPDTLHLDVQAFDRMAQFAGWLAEG
jgi:excisionase family DNA binding protein